MPGPETKESSLQAWGEDFCRKLIGVHFSPYVQKH